MPVTSPSALPYSYTFAPSKVLDPSWPSGCVAPAKVFTWALFWCITAYEHHGDQWMRQARTMNEREHCLLVCALLTLTWQRKVSLIACKPSTTDNQELKHTCPGQTVAPLKNIVTHCSMSVHQPFQCQFLFLDIIKWTLWFIFGYSEGEKMAQIMANAFLVQSSHSYLRFQSPI